MAHHTLMLAPGPEWGSAVPVGPWAEVGVIDPRGQFAAGLLCPPLPGSIAPQPALRVQSRRCSQISAAAQGVCTGDWVLPVCVCHARVYQKKTLNTKSDHSDVLLFLLPTQP